MSRPRHKQLEKLGMALHGGCAIVLLVIVGAFRMFWLVPLEQERSAMHEEILDIRQELKLAPVVRRTHAAQVEKMNDIEQQAVQTKQLIPDGPNESEFLRQTTHFADELGVVIVDYKRQDISGSGDHSVLTVNLKLEGTFGGLCHFLKRLENLPRISTVETLTIPGSGTSAPQGGNSAARKGEDGENEQAAPVYSADLTLKLYFRPVADRQKLAGGPRG